MRKTLIIITLLLGFLSIIGCVSDVKKTDSTITTPATNSKKQDNKTGWRQKAKAAQANKKNKKGKTGKATRPASRNKTKVDNSKLRAKYNKPVLVEMNKGVFISEIQKFIQLTPKKTAEVDELIMKYKRKGMDFRFFGGFYANKKPFARDLTKIFTPLQIEMFKHFHAYWYDRIPYPRPSSPVSLYYRLNLTKDQFMQISEIYSTTKLAMDKGNRAASATGKKQIEVLLNPQQKRIYREILSISPDNF